MCPDIQFNNHCNIAIVVDIYDVRLEYQGRCTFKDMLQSIIFVLFQVCCQQLCFFVTDCCQFLVNPLETEDEKTEKQKNLIKQRWLYVFGKPNTYNHL